MAAENINIVKEIIRKEGYNSVFAAIIDNKKYLEEMDYSRREVNKTLLELFGVDKTTIEFINEQAPIR